MGRRHRHLKGVPKVETRPIPESTPEPRTGPKIALGAPVAERAWILPQWWECLEQQTLQPDEYCFVYSKGTDDTKSELMRPGKQVHVFETRLPYHSRDNRNADQSDPWRASHMAQLRNQLRGMFRATDADVFISLDTDILLEEPTTLEQLVDTLSQGWDVAAPVTYLHPLGAQSYCYNAGFLAGGEGFDQAWRRVDSYDMRSANSPMRIDIPMAAFAITRHAMGMCSYMPHECGEDIGFAQRLKKHRFTVGWLQHLEVRHVWGKQYLEATYV